MNKRLYIIFIGLIILSSCKKKEYENSFVPFGTVTFQKSQSALRNYLEVRFQDAPVEWQGNGTIEVPEGEGTFEFYDKRNGEVLAKKTISIDADNPESYIIFQPTEDAPLAFLDPNEQVEEEAAPAGFMKFKIANYASASLPFERIDVIVRGFGPDGWVNLDTIESVGTDLGNAEYHLTVQGTNIESYRFSYLNSETKSPVLNARGVIYSLGGTIEPNSINPRPQKKVFTIYLMDENLGPDSSTGRIPVGTDLYDVYPIVLFAD